MNHFTSPNPNSTSSAAYIISLNEAHLDEPSLPKRRFQLICKHLRQSKFISIGLVLVATCLFIVIGIEAYLRIYLSTSVTSTTSTSINHTGGNGSCSGSANDPPVIDHTTTDNTSTDNTLLPENAQPQSSGKASFYPTPKWIRANIRLIDGSKDYSPSAVLSGPKSFIFMTNSFNDAALKALQTWLTDLFTEASKNTLFCAGLSSLQLETITSMLKDLRKRASLPSQVKLLKIAEFWNSLVKVLKQKINLNPSNAQDGGDVGGSGDSVNIEDLLENAKGFKEVPRFFILESLTESNFPALSKTIDALISIITQIELDVTGESSFSSSMLPDSSSIKSLILVVNYYNDLVGRLNPSDRKAVLASLFSI